MHNLCFSSIFCNILTVHIYLLPVNFFCDVVIFNWHLISLFLQSIWCVIVFTCTLKRMFFSLCASLNSQLTKWKKKIVMFHGFLIFLIVFFLRCSCVESIVHNCIGLVVSLGEKSAMNYEYFAQCKVLHVSFLSISWLFVAYSYECNNAKEDEKKINIEVEWPNEC